MKDEKELKATIRQERAAGKLKRARAIRLKCIDCMGYNPYEVTRCPSKSCPLWEFRRGRYTPIDGKANH